MSPVSSREHDPTGWAEESAVRKQLRGRFSKACEPLDALAVGTGRASSLGVSGGQGVSHYGGQGEPPLRGGCARVPRSKCPQPPVKGTWSETQVDDQGGSVLPAIIAHFLSAIDTLLGSSTLHRMKREASGVDSRIVDV